MSDDKDNQAGGGTATANKPATKRTAPTKGAADEQPQRTATGEGPAPDPTAKPADAPDTPISPGTTTTHKDVAKQREDQLKAGKVTGKAKTAAEKMANATPVEQRAKRLGVGLTEGRVDNMSRRDDSDALFGHFVQIDYSDKDALKAAEAILGEGNAGLGKGDYGVFVDVGDRDEHGYPITVTVMTRDEHAAQIPGIPYSAIAPAPQGGRR